MRKQKMLAPASSSKRLRTGTLIHMYALGANFIGTPTKSKRGVGNMDPALKEFALGGSRGANLWGKPDEVEHGVGRTSPKSEGWARAGNWMEPVWQRSNCSIGVPRNNYFSAAADGPGQLWQIPCQILGELGRHCPQSDLLWPESAEGRQLLANCWPTACHIWLSLVQHRSNPGSMLIRCGTWRSMSISDEAVDGRSG